MIKNFLKTSSIFCILLLVAACSYHSKKKETLEKIDHHQIEAEEVFYSNGVLYFKYPYEDEFFYLTADVEQPEEKKDASKVTLLKPRMAGRADRFEQKEPVHIVDSRWTQILKEIFIELIPKGENEGLVVFIQNYETMLYRGKNGKVDLVDLSKAPPSLKIVGRISSADLRKMVYARIKAQTAQAGYNDEKFLLRIDGIPLTPYIYIDTETDQWSELTLPSYYELEKEMTRLGFSTSFIYSFFVKSHLLGVIKAPFTSVHRLVSLSLTSLYVAFPPKYAEVKGTPQLNDGDECMDIEAFDAWLDKKVSRQRYKGSVRLLIDGDEFFPEFLLAMQRAEESIFTRVYIFATDPYAIRIADLMKERASAGVDVRVLMDELNTILNSTKTPATAYPADFVMPGNIKKYIRQDSPAKARTILNTWANFDHTKVFIVDRKIAYTGGMNIGDEYRYTWHDMMISLQGPVVGKLVKNFYEKWSFAGWGGDFAAVYRKIFSKRQRDVNKEEPGMIDIRLMYTKPGNAQIFDAQIEAIRRAKKRIYIQNAYFSDERIIGELINARGRGVDVRVILPGINDVTIMYQNNLVKANRMLRNGIRVYFYNGMSHVKAALYDGWAVVGSSNMDKMSLFVNSEMSLGISDPKFVEELETRLFEKDFANSKEMEQPVETAWTSFIVDMLASQL